MFEQDCDMFNNTFADLPLLNSQFSATPCRINCLISERDGVQRGASQAQADSKEKR